MYVKLYHKNWTDFISIKDNRIKRFLDNKDEGECKFIDNFLMIKWDKWNSELFYTKNNIFLNEIDSNISDMDNCNEYYLIENNTLFNTTFSTTFSNENNNSSSILFNNLLVYNIDIIENNNIIYCIIDNLTNRVYKQNLDYIGIIKIINNNIILIDNKEYIYINFKYYAKNDIIKESKIIDIDNELYFLSNNSNNSYCTKNYNFSNKYRYTLYKNILKINNKYYKTDNNYNYFNISIDFLCKMNLSYSSEDKKIFLEQSNLDENKCIFSSTKVPENSSLSPLCFDKFILLFFQLFLM
jgi:hypothetical protein